MSTYQEHAHAVRRDYFLRLATVAVLGLALVIIICAALLVPTHLLLSKQIKTKKSEPNAFEEKMSYIHSFDHATTASATLRTVLATAHPGVHIKGITLSVPTDAVSDTMTLSGAADSRDALRTYYLTLQAVPAVLSINVPVSTYAKESNLPFTITLEMKSDTAP